MLGWESIPGLLKRGTNSGSEERQTVEAHLGQQYIEAHPG
jgi:hypothetical protein